MGKIVFTAVLVFAIAAAFFAGASIQSSRLIGRVAELEVTAGSQKASREKIEFLQMRIDELERQLAVVFSQQATKQLLDVRAIRDLPSIDQQQPGSRF